MVTLIALAVPCFLSMAIGTRSTSLSTVWSALTSFDTANTDHLVIMELRLPRTILGLLVGLCFGIPGAIFQAVIKNPLASPDIIGITSGASASAVLAILIFGSAASPCRHSRSWARCAG